MSNFLMSNLFMKLQDTYSGLKEDSNFQIDIYINERLFNKNLFNKFCHTPTPCCKNYK